MSIWVLTLCTAAWGLCGHYAVRDYETEQQCYKAMNNLYKHKGADHFKYITCSKKKINPQHTEQ